MRAHPIYLTFQRKWQLPVYFQLRWKDIVGKLEDALSSKSDTTLMLSNGERFFSFACICPAERAINR